MIRPKVQPGTYWKVVSPGRYHVLLKVCTRLEQKGYDAVVEADEITLEWWGRGGYPKLQRDALWGLYVRGERFSLISQEHFENMLKVYNLT